MKDSDWICKECGSTDIIAEVEASGEVGVRIYESKTTGKPYTIEDDWDFPDPDVIGYVCECGATAPTIEKLVVKRRAFDELRLPCGRCDHDAREHPQVGRLTAEAKKAGFTPPPMPCTIEGCDCHDYYDTALGLEPTWSRPGQGTLEGATAWESCPIRGPRQRFIRQP